MVEPEIVLGFVIPIVMIKGLKQFLEVEVFNIINIFSSEFLDEGVANFIYFKKKSDDCQFLFIVFCLWGILEFMDDMHLEIVLLSGYLMLRWSVHV